MRKFFIAETNPRGHGAGVIYPNVRVRIEVIVDAPRTDLECLQLAGSMIFTGNLVQVTRVEIDEERKRAYEESLPGKIEAGAAVAHPDLDGMAAEILSSKPQPYNQSD